LIKRHYLLAKLVIFERSAFGSNIVQRNAVAHCSKFLTFWWIELTACVCITLVGDGVVKLIFLSYCFMQPSANWQVLLQGNMQLISSFCHYCPIVLYWRFCAKWFNCKNSVKHRKWPNFVFLKSHFQTCRGSFRRGCFFYNPGEKDILSRRGSCKIFSNTLGWYYLTLFFTINQINWYGARDACKRKGMKHATPRSQTELNDVASELRRRGFSNKNYINVHQSTISGVTFLQTRIPSGYPCRTSAMRRDSFTGRTDMPWTIRCGTQENQTLLVLERRRVPS
jgi:hypothetical protein